MSKSKLLATIFAVVALSCSGAQAGHQGDKEGGAENKVSKPEKEERKARKEERKEERKARKEERKEERKARKEERKAQNELN